MQSELMILGETAKISRPSTRELKKPTIGLPSHIHGWISSLIEALIKLKKSDEWTVFTGFTPIKLIDGTHSGTAEKLMRRRNGTAWQYRRLSAEEDFELMDREAW
ncbi:hypothetical protein ACLBWX_14535 [Methylobacterium sp. M6A4_1b]